LDAYGYNEVNDLVSYTPSSGASATYVYDGNGLLQSETVTSTTTNYTWSHKSAEGVARTTCAWRIVSCVPCIARYEAWGFPHGYLI
jgi:YD repeat-containing protein